MKPYRLLIPLLALCLLLAGAHDSRSASLGPAPDPGSLSVQARPEAPLIPAFFRFHPRFYQEDGATGRSSTLYLQNPNSNIGTYVLELRDCASGTPVFGPIWTIAPGATQVAGPGDFPDLPPGCYGLVISSDSSLAHASLVEETQNGGPATDRLATYPGFAREEAASGLRFGPLLKGDVSSTVHIWNVSNYASATLTATAYGEAGSPVTLPACTAAPFAQCTFDLSALPELPTPFTGTLVIQATGGSVMGLMALGSASGATHEYRKPLAAGAAEVCLPRVFKHANEGGVPRSTALFVANTTDQAANVTLRFYAANGAPAAADQDFNLAANGSRYLRLADVESLGAGVWSVCASGSRPLALEELTQADAPSTAPASSATRMGNKLGTSELTDPAHLALTHLVRSEASYTAFSLQNPWDMAASVDLNYYDLAGALVYTDTVNLPPKGWVRFNQSAQSELGPGYVGSPVVNSSQPLVSLVDVYEPPLPKLVFLPLLLR